MSTDATDCTALQFLVGGCADLLCHKAQAGLAVPGELLYEADLGARSVDEHRRHILAIGAFMYIANLRRIPLHASSQKRLRKNLGANTYAQRLVALPL